MIFKRKRHQELVEIIGDPRVPEPTWLAACTAVGEASVTERKLPSVRGPVLTVARVGAVAILTAHLGLTWVAYAAVIQEQATLMAGLNEDWVSNAVPLMYGVIFSIFGTIGFWQRFYAPTDNKIRAGLWLASTLGVLAIALMVLFAIEPYKLALAACCAALCFLPMSRLAAWARNALPSSFRAERTLLLTALSVLPVLALLIFGCLAPDQWTDALDFPDQLEWPITFLIFMMPAYAAARVARTTSMVSCLALNTVLNAPLLLGVLATVILTPIMTMDAAHALRTGVLCLSVLGSTLSLVAVLAAGSYAGVKHNQMIAAKISRIKPH